MELQSSEVASLSRKFKIMPVIAVVVYCSEAKQQKLILGHVSFQSKDCNFGDGRRMIYAVATNTGRRTPGTRSPYATDTGTIDVHVVASARTR